jgi:hypothetical protein
MKTDGRLLLRLHVAKFIAVIVAVQASEDLCIRNAKGVSYTTSTKKNN